MDILCFSLIKLILEAVTRDKGNKILISMHYKKKIRMMCTKMLAVVFSDLSVKTGGKFHYLFSRMSLLNMNCFAIRLTFLKSTES